MEEGSVEVEGQAYDDSETTVEGSDERSSLADNQARETTTNQTPQPDQGGQPDQGQPQQGQQPQTQPNETELTEKGTKLDPNPLSAANQRAANAEARAREYEAFLNNPQQVEAYLQQLRQESGQQAPQQSAPDQELSPDQIETVDDLRKYARQLDDRFSKQINQLKQERDRERQVETVVKTGERITRQIDEARTKYPELREKNADGSPNPDFDPVLDEKLGRLYESLDYDQRTRMFKGQVDFLKLADDLMDTYRTGTQKGSKSAQTVIQDRRAGRVVTGSRSSGDGVDESGMTPSQKIAARMKLARQK